MYYSINFSGRKHPRVQNFGFFTPEKGAYDRTMKALEAHSNTKDLNKNGLPRAYDPDSIWVEEAAHNTYPLFGIPAGLSLLGHVAGGVGQSALGLGALASGNPLGAALVADAVGGKWDSSHLDTLPGKFELINDVATPAAGIALTAFSPMPFGEKVKDIGGSLKDLAIGIPKNLLPRPKFGGGGGLFGSILGGVGNLVGMPMATIPSLAYSALNKGRMDRGRKRAEQDFLHAHPELVQLAKDQQAAADQTLKNLS